MNPDDARSQFITDLHSESQSFSTFLELLRTEQAALQANDVDALTRLAQVKAERISTLNELARRRAAYLIEQGSAPDRAGMAQWLLTRGGSDQGTLSPLWQGLLASAAEAKATNRENGLLIETRLQHNQRLLGALAAGGQPSLYGPDGQTRVGSSGRDLGTV